MRLVLFIALTLASPLFAEGNSEKNNSYLLVQTMPCQALLDSGPVTRTSLLSEEEVMNGVYQGVAQQYDNLNGQQLTGVFFRGRVNPAGSTSSNNLKVTVYSVAQGLPGSILRTQNILANASASAYDMQVTFTSALAISGSIIISVEPLSPLTDDFFIQRNTAPDGQNLNLIKVKQANQWFKNLAAGDPAFDYDFLILPVTTKNLTASFTYSGSGGTVNFQNTSLNGSSYLWDFGDTQTSLQASPQHTYAASGTYAVKLVATSNGLSICQDSTTISIPVTVTGLDHPEAVSLLELPEGNIVREQLKVRSSVNLTVGVYSLGGTKCGEFQLVAGELSAIPMDQYAVGTYLLQGAFKPVRFIKTK